MIGNIVLEPHHTCLTVTFVVSDPQENLRGLTENAFPVTLSVNICMGRPAAQGR